MDGCFIQTFSKNRIRQEEIERDLPCKFYLTLSRNFKSIFFSFSTLLFTRRSAEKIGFILIHDYSNFFSLAAFLFHSTVERIKLHRFVD